MSLFEDFVDAAFTEASNVIGTVDFAINGKSFYGVHNEHQVDSREIEIEGASYLVSSTIVADVDQFNVTNTEKELTGKTLVCEGRSYKIVTVSIDTAAVTLGLSTLSKNR